MAEYVGVSGRGLVLFCVVLQLKVVTHPWVRGMVGNASSIELQRGLARGTSQAISTKIYEA